MRHALRNAQPADREFCRALYIASMWPIMQAHPGWTEARLGESFDSYFQVGATHIITDEKNDPIGWVQVEDKGDYLFISYLYVIASMQGRGIGTAVLKSVLNEAREVGKRCEIRAVKNNVGALRLYQRLGFAISGEDTLKYRLTLA